MRYLMAVIYLSMVLGCGITEPTAPSSNNVTPEDTTGTIDTSTVEYRNLYKFYNTTDSAITIHYGTIIEVEYHFAGDIYRILHDYSVLDSVAILPDGEWEYGSDSDTLWYEINKQYYDKFARFSILTKFNEELIIE